MEHPPELPLAPFAGGATQWFVWSQMFGATQSSTVEQPILHEVPAHLYGVQSIPPASFAPTSV